MLLGLCGAALAGTGPGPGWIAAALLGWFFIAIIVESDIHDASEDQAQGRSHPYSRIDLAHVRTSAGLILLALLYSHVPLGLAISLFFLLGLLYSTPPFRLKGRRFPSMYLVEGGWAFFAVLAGAAAAGGPPAPALLLACATGAGFFLASPLKDRKDIAGDRACGVPSLYVVLLERRMAQQSVERVAGALVLGVLLSGAALTALLVPGSGWIAGAMALAATGSGLFLAFHRSPTRATELSLLLVNVYLALGVLAYLQ